MAQLYKARLLILKDISKEKPESHQYYNDAFTPQGLCDLHRAAPVRGRRPRRRGTEWPDLRRQGREEQSQVEKDGNGEIERL